MTAAPAKKIAAVDADPLREGLAAAIADKARAEAALNEHREAIARANRLVVAANEKLAAAHQAVETAKADYAAAIASDPVAAAEAVAAVRRARETAVAAADEVVAAKEAAERLRQRELEFVDDVKVAQIDIVAARNAMTASVIKQMIEDAQAAKQLYLAACQVVETLGENDVTLPNLADAIETITKHTAAVAPLARLRTAVADLRLLPRHHGGERERVWREWRARLLLDPTVEPPELT